MDFTLIVPVSRVSQTHDSVEHACPLICSAVNMASLSLEGNVAQINDTMPNKVITDMTVYSTMTPFRIVKVCFVAWMVSSMAFFLLFFCEIVLSEDVTSFFSF